VIRWESYFSWAFLDVENNLLSFHSWDNIRCGVGDEMVLMQFQDIENPSDQDLWIELAKSKDHWIFVYDWTGLTWADVSCSLPYLDERLFAIGKGNLVSNDNDYYHWWDHDRNRANSFGIRGQGKVTDFDGNEYHYNMVYYVVWKKNTGKADNYKETINLVKKGK
jgi:hypothetical protein